MPRSVGKHREGDEARELFSASRTRPMMAFTISRQVGAPREHSPIRGVFHAAARRGRGSEHITEDYIRGDRRIAGAGADPYNVVLAERSRRHYRHRARFAYSSARRQHDFHGKPGANAVLRSLVRAYNGLAKENDDRNEAAPLRTTEHRCGR